ncbi:MAG: hypothetical protein AAGI03_01490 [Pseudomonadota bacterium]
MTFGVRPPLIDFEPYLLGRLRRAVLALWADENDTNEIARLLGVPEAKVCRVIHDERRDNARRQAAEAANEAAHEGTS